MLYLRAPSWPDGPGDGDKSLEILAGVCKRHPHHPLNHIFYAQALWELEEEDALEKIKKHLLLARNLLEGEAFGRVRQRWGVEIKEVVDDSEIKLPPLSYPSGSKATPSISGKKQSEREASPGPDQ